MAVDIDIADLTNGSLNISNEWEGTGVFDVLISAVSKNIEGEYQKGRITGNDYANVYLGSMQTVIAQSMQYVLQEKQVEAQVELLEEQTKAAYTERVAKDKETVTLGMDDTISMAETAKQNTTDFIYTPYYEDV